MVIAVFEGCFGVGFLLGGTVALALTGVFSEGFLVELFRLLTIRLETEA